jgi:hypothetical protein
MNKPSEKKFPPGSIVWGACLWSGKVELAKARVLGGGPARLRIERPDGSRNTSPAFDFSNQIRIEHAYATPREALRALHSKQAEKLLEAEEKVALERSLLEVIRAALIAEGT